ncbi:MAG TPA: ATP-binding protein [Paenalcaligenes sp.]|nr:ATP-binding protein [Paenalcaligenes sp.]
MRFNLFFKLFLAILITSIVVVLAMGFAVRWSFERGFVTYIEEREQQRIDALTQMLLEDYQEFGQNWDFIRENRSHWWRALRATTQTHSSDRHGGPRQRSFSLPRTTLLDANGEVIAGNFPEHESNLQRYPLNVEGQIVGSIVAPAPEAHFLDANAERRFQTQQLSATWSIVGLCVLLAALVSYVLARKLLKPIRHIGRATHHLAAGNYATRIHITNTDELGQLANDFNALAGALEANEKVRMALVADISHELRTPMAVLQGEIEALTDGLRQPTPETLHSLKQEVLHLNQLIDDLYMLSLADAGALHYDFDDDVALCPILKRCLDALQQRISEAGIQSQLQCDNVPTVYADPLRLTQVFNNILENSLRYTDSPGQLHISLSHDADYVYVTVDDSAPGVPPNDQHRIFDRLFRVDSSRNRARGGAGLGLALCQRIIHAHQGTIDASTSHLGGLQLRIALPRHHRT